MTAPSAKKAARIRRAWRLGRLKYKLRPYQDAAYEALWSAILDAGVLKFCLNISRRWGKTHVLCLIAVEMCLRKPGAQVRFAAPTGLELRKRTIPIMRTILRDCPANLRPRWNGQDKCWSFPNGSQIHVAGVNNGHAEDLRGAGCDLAIIDEGGFIDEFDYLVGSVLLPMTLEEHGTLLAGSTPPKTLAHDYYDFATECKAKGNYFERDIHSAGKSPEEIALYAEESGGFESTTWKREYLAQFVVDEELQIVPDWKPEYARAAVPSELRRYWHQYEAMDIGATKDDWTAVLFAHYDFSEAHLYVEDELCDMKMPRWTTEELTRRIREKERALWCDPDVADAPPPTIKQRIADNNAPELLVDMAAKHSMPFYPVSKDELYAMVNKVRMWVKTGRISVHPRCEKLILCLERGIWKDKEWVGREFLRSRALGHLDPLAALVYLVRNIDEHTNPVPWDHGFDGRTQAASRHASPQSALARELSKLQPRRRVARRPEPMRRAA